MKYTEMNHRKILSHIIEDFSLRRLENFSQEWRNNATILLKNKSDVTKIWHEFAIFLLSDHRQCGLIHPFCKIVRQALLDELKDKQIDWNEIIENYDELECPNSINAKASFHFIQHHRLSVKSDNYWKIAWDACKNARECAEYILYQRIGEKLDWSYIVYSNLCNFQIGNQNNHKISYQTVTTKLIELLSNLK